ncbi:MAG TPA: hypothetical protein VI279_08025 [Rhodocyclaceae bacterium]
MAVQRFRVYDPWLSEEDQRFALALFFSALAHLVFVLAWKMPPSEWQSAGRSTLSVSFRASGTEAHPDKPAATPAKTAAAERSAVLVKAQAPIAVAPPPTKASITGAPIAKASQAGEPSASTQSQPTTKSVAPPGVEAPSARPGWVNALLSIRENGEVGQILWRELPALTNQQLRRLESSIRAKNYGNALAGRTVNEAVDVRPYLTEAEGRESGTAAEPQPQ